MTVAGEAGLLELMAGRLAKDDLTPRAAELVLAACRGEAALERALAGVPSRQEAPRERTNGPGQEIFVSEIRVRGFRGIGPQARLPLAPGPGLTVVTGRNGSGKSSFAEAAELALTGYNSRWTRARHDVWRLGWRNLHQRDTAVELELVEAARTDRTTIRRQWAPQDNLAQGEWTQDNSPFDDSKWHEALETYRPFLPYSELGTVLDAQPEDLYEAMHRLLGLEAITEAQQALAEHRKRLAEIVARPHDRRERVRAELLASQDERARHAAALLGSDSPDLDAIADLALGADVGTGTNLLHQIMDVTLPPDDEIDRVRETLDLALGAVTVVATANAQDSLRCSEILRLAIQLQESGGSQTCPVCDLGRLDGMWLGKARERAEHLARAAAELHEAADRLDVAVAATRALCLPVPEVLAEAQGVLDTTIALQAWHAWEACVSIDDPVRLRQELFGRYAELVQAVDQLKAVAREQIDRRDLVWRPMAIALFEWHSLAQQALADAEVLAGVTEAENWIRKTAATLRSERIAPFAKESQRIWQRLRQQSNVDLGAVRLGGTRNVELDVSVDGVSNSALAVMSQGELHSLGLALFLPRALVDESPFRFVMIDDPVQAMDPSKVDGLAQVLADVGLTRQVVVFTHDERLVEALRRLRLPATVWDVCRGEDSVVQVRMSDDPVGRCLGDARAMRVDEDLPDALRAELVASCCRAALEAASHARFRRERLGRGVPHAEVERLLECALTTRQKLALAVLDDLAEPAKLLPHLEEVVGSWAVDLLLACRIGGESGDLDVLIRDTELLAGWLQR
ncbi:AAA family ATPase [Lentzea albidocapillata]|uniref:RecF/RecN/SMC N terminal domain-containing protein n=1 Tax=Lentzea albidocapillata TaxID=40571 RepID=A0A1W2FS18_9PSEU|nr:AAA family ATPase [Lentzea albidocapillata]SMD24767.1 RecF/RecN/SMC N terminal domain-containing protein [Lentzea albidocapillata]